MRTVEVEDSAQNIALPRFFWKLAQSDSPSPRRGQFTPSKISVGTSSSLHGSCDVAEIRSHPCTTKAVRRQPLKPSVDHDWCGCLLYKDGATIVPLSCCCSQSVVDSTVAKKIGRAHV